jgi:hypothetical protein
VKSFGLLKPAFCVWDAYFELLIEFGLDWRQRLALARATSPPGRLATDTAD